MSVQLAGYKKRTAQSTRRIVPTKKEIGGKNLCTDFEFKLVALACYGLVDVVGDFCHRKEVLRRDVAPLISPVTRPHEPVRRIGLCFPGACPKEYGPVIRRYLESEALRKEILKKLSGLGWGSYKVIENESEEGKKPRNEYRCTLEKC